MIANSAHPGQGLKIHFAELEGFTSAVQQPNGFPLNWQGPLPNPQPHNLHCNIKVVEESYPKWTTGRKYRPSARVMYGAQAYLCVVTNENVVPAGNPSFWVPILTPNEEWGSWIRFGSHPVGKGQPIIIDTFFL